MRFGMRPYESFVIGDKDSNVEAGNNLGAVTVRIRGSRSPLQPNQGAAADYDTPNLPDTAKFLATFTK